MAEIMIMTETVVHVPEAKWAGTMNFYQKELGEPDKVVPTDSPLKAAREVEREALHFVRGWHDLVTENGLDALVGRDNASAFATGLADLLHWTGGSLPTALTSTLGRVAVPGQFVNEMADGPDPEDESSADGNADAMRSEDSEKQSEGLSDEAFEKNTSESVVEGVIHNPNF
ncbi:hypothetical protein [Hymenobacter terricola]|uniref:hypothetical protein n=1 Tax=Hymenobacter terricola TaxID=2819236 RepID=UPI001B314A43|nr:hypothetical protein [Hymenobacter terricola]